MRDGKGRARRLWPKRLLAAALAGALLTQTAVLASAEKLIDKYAILFDGEAVAYESDPGYADVLSSWRADGYKEAAAGTPDIVIQAAQYSGFSGEEPAEQMQEGRNGLLFGTETEYVEWTFTVPETGLYQMHIGYYALDGTGQPIQRAALLDGEKPYAEADVLVLPRYYVDSADPVVNTVGDEVGAIAQEVREWTTRAIGDMAGRYSEPLLWLLEAGTHTLRLSYVDQPVLLSEIRFSAPEAIPDYAEVKAEYDEMGYQPAQEPISFQAEDRDYIVNRSDSTISSYNDGDPKTVPKGTAHRRLNAMGGYSWRTGNQEITYTFEVETAGLYHIAFRAQQTWNAGMSSYRQILIDGEVPFREMLEYAFPSSSSWYTQPLADSEGNPYSFYLSEGKHTLTLSAKVSGYVTQAYNKAQVVIEDLSEVYRKILMITSASPDPNYDYDLEKSIPDLLDTFQRLADEIGTIRDLVVQASGEGASVINNLEMVRQQLVEMIEDTDIIAKRLDDIVNSLTVLGNFLTDVQSTPLGIDSIELVPEGGEFTVRQSSVWERIVGTLENFVYSFQKDYNSVGLAVEDQEVTETIDVWISRGTEWAEILKGLIDSDFTPKHGIGVNLNVLPSNTLMGGTVNAMLLSITSGNAPDVALSVSVDTPVEYAIRGVSADLTKFEDYPAVSERFLENSLIPFRYDGGVYGLPETINFNVMIYRKDILSSRNLSLPQTWDQVFYQTLPVLYQNNMQMASPTLDLLLYQMGGEYYTQDGLRTALDEPEAYAAFEQYISLFLDLGYPITSNFYNRFRTGEMPIGIADYTVYMQILTAAPELAGKWGLAPVPGIEQEDGTIDRSTTGMTAMADIVLEGTGKEEESWEFLKWWTSTEIQQAFGMQVEGKIGASARWNTANIEAFQALPWSQEHLDVLMDSFEWATAVPSVLGGVITTRAISNATNDALYNDYSPREALEKAIDTINKELERKQDMYDIHPTESKGGAQ